ncbi:hypothetical protein B0T18DRAFT_417958 [Schizothecium vesticola]|uniref:Transmembrane protein n=1 Tax=Schizothecium vesticola TaxID=314040 RepID=A0AA40EJG7_9PEZI|nr:hypothetical protein B0T18DRAFT_417958 [Schizothecium vesticola]
MSSQSKRERMGGRCSSSSDGVLFFGLVCAPSFSSNLSVFSSCTWIPPPFFLSILFYLFFLRAAVFSKVMAVVLLFLRAIYPPVRPRFRLGRRLISLVPLPLLVCSCRLGLLLRVCIPTWAFLTRR